METAILDAADMSIFEDESFDVVLNMGPFYHLVHISSREKCVKESLRVLKKNGLLITAYIPRYYVFQYAAMQNKDFLDAGLAQWKWRKSVARRGNTNKRAEARLKVLELRAKGKSSKEIGAVMSFHPAYITTLTAKYRAGGIEAIQWKPLWRKPPEHEPGEGSRTAGRVRKAKRGK